MPQASSEMVKNRSFGNAKAEEKLKRHALGGRIPEPEIRSIDLFVTEKCNMNCSYCFHKSADNTLELEQGKRILKRLKEISPKGMIITFFGGEPLLYPETVLDLAKYALELWGKEARFYISTNGTYFNKEMFEEYRKLKMGLQISFDGDERANQERGSFTLVKDNIVKSLKIFPDLNVRMTFTPKNVSLLAKSVEFIHRLGVINIMHHAVMEAAWSDEVLAEYAYQLRNIYHYRRYMLRRKIPFKFYFIDRALGIVNDEKPAETEYCQAGKNYIAIIPDGDIYPCHRAASMRLFRLGNIFNEKRPFVRGMFLTLDKETTGCAYHCEAARTCHSCPVTHYKVNRDLTKPLVDNQYCQVCKIEHSLAKTYLHIEETDKQERLLKSIGSVVADLSDEIKEIQTKMREVKDAKPNSA